MNKPNIELEKEIKKSGLKLYYIAGNLGIDRTTLYKKLKGQRSFTESEITALKKILGNKK